MSSLEPSEIESRLSEQLAARRERQRRELARQRRTRATGAVVALLLVGTAIATVLALLPTASVNRITGTVRCSSGAHVQGVWIEEAQGEGDFASWNYVGGDEELARFSFDLRGTRYSVHVGCGGTGKRWSLDARSDMLSGGPYDFLCYDRPADPQYGDCVAAQEATRRA